ncbi:hypothetical protein GOBAR_AA25529 [Gossypium barbadense]|uniref:Uncharacterized protein n=1 Tax=Gossypium barbadense TaxID=3634 RepID=A0A2P5WVL4_GOSBA|nr:hypothetical protein GOBAR_AA25529 [Gossypium barbadense]
MSSSQGKKTTIPASKKWKERHLPQQSIPEFGAALGLYTEKFKEENELHALTRQIRFSPSKCWHTLAPGAASYNPSRSKASEGERALASSTLTMPTFYGVCRTGTSSTLPISSPSRFSSIGPYVTRLAWHFGLLDTAAQKSSLNVSKRHLEHEEAYEDIPDDVPPQHGDPPTQPPPPSRPVHAAASYADISERLTRFK